LDYDDPVAVAAQIPHTWWLDQNSCKLILSVLVHKDNKDILTQPTKLPPGPTCADVRAKAKKTVEKEQATAKLQHSVSTVEGDVSIVSDKYGNDVEHHAQISVTHQLEDVYVSRMGRDWYERQLVNLVNQMPGMLVAQARDIEQFTSQPHRRTTILVMHLTCLSMYVLL
jgi:hypothetical protein